MESGQTKKGASLTTAVVLLALTGCFQPSAEAQARLAALEAEGKAMDTALDSIEERLLGNQSMVKLWEEMGERHRSVSEIACTNSSKHQLEMALLLEKQGVKKRKSRRGRFAEPREAIGGPATSRQRPNSLNHR